MRVAVREHGCLLVVEVADDGVGGADASGSGLRGLADRVAAAAGTFEINSPAGPVLGYELACGQERPGSPRGRSWVRPGMGRRAPVNSEGT